MFGNKTCNSFTWYVITNNCDKLSNCQLQFDQYLHMCGHSKHLNCKFPLFFKKIIKVPSLKYNCEV